MANLKDYEKLTSRERQIRYFSEDFKRKKVSEIERNLIGVSALCREYQVTRSSVYKWIYKYSGMRKKGVRQVVEAKSDSQKIAALRAQVKELERIIGEKQVKLDFQEKMIEIAESEYKVILKKSFLANPPLVLGRKENPPSETQQAISLTWNDKAIFSSKAKPSISCS